MEESVNVNISYTNLLDRPHTTTPPPLLCMFLVGSWLFDPTYGPAGSGGGPLLLHTATMYHYSYSKSVRAWKTDWEGRREAETFLCLGSNFLRQAEDTGSYIYSKFTDISNAVLRAD